MNRIFKNTLVVCAVILLYTTQSFALPTPECGDLGSYDPNTQTCTEILTPKSQVLTHLKINNTVNVKSSRMQVWTCGAGLLNKDQTVGSDNRLYGKASVYKKGTSTLAITGLGSVTNEMSIAVEAVDAMSSELSGGDVHLNYFNTQTHTELSDLVAEFSSLKYGVGMYLDVCLDLPFSYEEDESTHYSAINIKTSQAIVNLDVATDAERLSYISGASPKLSTEVQCSRNTSTVRVNSGQSELWGMINILDDTLTPEYVANINSVPVTTDQFYTGISHSVPDVTANNLKKCVVRFVFQEEANSEARIKGIYEGLRWQTSVEVNLQD